MPESDLFRIFLSRLEKSGLQYMVTGAAAAIVYGQPRLTHDIDLVVEMSEGDAWKVSHVFPQDQFYCPPIEVLEQEARRALRGHFNVIHHSSGFKADFYLKGRDALHRWAMTERRRMDFEGLPIWVAPPEYVILRKLEYYREGGSEKHLRDIAGIVELSPEQIDMDALMKRIGEYGLESEWEEVRKLG